MERSRCDGPRSVNFVTPSRSATPQQPSFSPAFADTGPLPLSSSAHQQQGQSPNTMLHAFLPGDQGIVASGRHEQYNLTASIRKYHPIRGQRALPSPPLAPGDPSQGQVVQNTAAIPNACSLSNLACTSSVPISWSLKPSTIPSSTAESQDEYSSEPRVFVGVCMSKSVDNIAMEHSGISSSLADNLFQSERAYPFPSQLTPEPEAFDVDVSDPEELFVGQSASTAPSHEAPMLRRQGEPTNGLKSPSRLDVGEEETKLDEPYAKLIFRAFMSSPDRAMTLQDIYQWFRENTNKAVNGKGGWQNSIRHNLSMNAAFTKRHRREEAILASGDRDSRRTNEWVLEDWAVQCGVQSTTRYRKGSARRRTTGHCPPQTSGQATQHSAKRALSGRKGGCAAREARLRHRACGRGRQATSASVSKAKQCAESHSRATMLGLSQADDTAPVCHARPSIACSHKVLHDAHSFGARPFELLGAVDASQAHPLVSFASRPPGSCENADDSGFGAYSWSAQVSLSFDLQQDFPQIYRSNNLKTALDSYASSRPTSDPMDFSALSSSYNVSEVESFLDNTSEMPLNEAEQCDLPCTMSRRMGNAPGMPQMMRSGPAALTL